MNETLLSSASVGAGVGATVGNVTGNRFSLENRMRTTAIGALTGAVISGAMGYFIHKLREKRDVKIRRQTLFDLDKYDVSMPKGFETSSYHGLTIPKVQSEWVPTRVEGKKLIEGHKIFLITDEAQWIPNQELKQKSNNK